jgi:diguanylate cyclase (GGDEF)-like protein
MPDSKPPPRADGATPQVKRPAIPEAAPVSERAKFTRTVAADSNPLDGPASSLPKSAYLTVIAGPQIGAVIKLPSGELKLGRAPECNVRVDSEGVSWTHARIFRAGPLFMIEDLKSTNGTGLNDKRISASLLNDGDRIRLGPSVLLRFDLWDELEAGVQIQLYESAVKDVLTKAWNRKYFQDRLQQELAFASRHEVPLSLIIFDIDFFKKVNDTYGHHGGDAVLRAVSAAMLTAVRAEDVFARIGGEEFVVIAPGLDGAAAVRFAERLRAVVEALTIPFEDLTIRVTSSFGVSSLVEVPEREGGAFLALADKRLYEAKTSGRNRVVGAADQKP